jgi:hypothetical protein
MSTKTRRKRLVAEPKGSVMLPRPSLTSVTLDDLLADSLIQTVMQADGVEPEAVRALMDGAARRLAAGRASQHNGAAFARADGVPGHASAAGRTPVPRPQRGWGCALLLTACR